MRMQKTDGGLIVTTAVAMVLMLLAVWSIDTRVLPSPGNKWNFSTVHARIKSGAGAIEFGQNAWLTGEDLVVEIANTEYIDVDVIIEIRLGPSPCGDFVNLKTKVDDHKIRRETSNSYVISQRVPFDSVIDLALSVTGIQCKIDSDPRIFVGSVESPAIKEWNVVK